MTSMTEPNLISLQPGTIIAGRYEVVKSLGSGSMGTVYACRHRELAGHLVAMKVLFPEIAQDRVASARFRNEISASYGVSHPNVVRAYEYVRDGDLVAYTMEYVGGGDLAEKLGRPHEPIPIPDCVRILAQMCSGVQAIHDAGIVHRDLKPENIFLTRDMTVKIGDFGIARAGAGPRLTEHGGVVGTIDYVSPEYMLNSQVDWRSDIYAMGILAYEMVAGETPFKGDTVYAVMTKRLKSDPLTPSRIRSDCPPELDRIILKGMARDPDARYQSAAEMLYDLQAFMPDSVGSAGAYLTVTQKASKTYVGPVLNSAGGGDATSEQPQEQEAFIEPKSPAAPVFTAPLPPEPAASHQESTPGVSSGKTNYKNALVDAGRPAMPSALVGGSSASLGLADGSSVVPAGGSSVPSGSSLPESSPSYAAMPDPTPKRLDPVLARENSASQAMARAREVRLGGAIDNSRFKSLTESAQRKRVNGPPDWMIPLIAIVLGVMLGVMCMQVFFPQMFKSLVSSAIGFMS